MPPRDPIWNLPALELERELIKLPSIVTWSRLEPMSLSPDLTPGLQTLLGDPLWMLARQWQFNELAGEDGGTPISAVTEAQHARLSRLHAGTPGEDASGQAVDLLDDDAPLEPLVEAEAVAIPADRIRAEAGLQLLRMLTAAGLTAQRNNAIDRWKFAARPSSDQDPGGSARATVFAGRVPDAGLVKDEIQPFAAETGAISELPAGFPDAGTAETRLRELLGAWLRWYDSYLVTPSTGVPSWDSRRQEYSFAVQAELSPEPAALTASEYTSGRLDWADFDIDPRLDLGAAEPSRPSATTRAVLIPTPARFAGMPADRLWQFEDAKVYLGGIEAGPTDLARMAMVEFALTFGNDWFVLPVDLPAGSVVNIDSLTIRDTFGFAVSVEPARQPGGWSMFGHTTRAGSGDLDGVFVIPPVLPHKLESDPIEEVALFRDEMANLVWGVERIVQAASGEPVHRARLATPVSLRQQLPGDLDDASIVYRLMSPVPDHWVPFVAVQAANARPGSIELERRPLLHFRDDGSTDLTHPRGLLLRSTLDADPAIDRLRLADEEIRRDGAIVTRTYQLARTPAGGSVLWIGRRKRTGEGEGWSGLRFDTALPPGA